MTAVKPSVGYLRWLAWIQVEIATAYDRYNSCWFSTTIAIVNIADKYELRSAGCVDNSLEHRQAAEYEPINSLRFTRH